MAVFVKINGFFLFITGILNVMIFAAFIGYRLFHAAGPLFRQIMSGKWRQWKLITVIKKGL